LPKGGIAGKTQQPRKGAAPVQRRLIHEALKRLSIEKDEFAVEFGEKSFGIWVAGHTPLAGRVAGHSYRYGGSAIVGPQGQLDRAEAG